MVLISSTGHRGPDRNGLTFDKGSGQALFATDKVAVDQQNMGLFITDAKVFYKSLGRDASLTSMVRWCLESPGGSRRIREA